MAEGVFQTDRVIFDNPIWKNPAKFRLFFYIYGNAIFLKEGFDIAGIHLERGQLLKSYRSLADDLEYIENHAIKKYSISYIKKLVHELIKEKRIKLEVLQLGTLFTVLNYEQYQGFERFEKDNIERSENAERTQRERSENNNNKDKNVKKEKKINICPKKQFSESVTLTEIEYAKLITQYGEEDTKRLVDILNNYKLSSGKKYKSDYHTLIGWVSKKLAEDKEKESVKPKKQSMNDWT